MFNRLFLTGTALTFATAPLADAACVDFRSYLHEINVTDTSSYGADVAVNGSLAFVADTWHGLKVYDVADLESPTLLGEISLPDRVDAVAAVGDFAYAISRYGGLLTIDASDPSIPVEVAQAEFTADAVAVHIDADRLYVVAGNVYVFSLANPAFPVNIGQIDTGSARDVVVADGRAYVGLGGGYRIYDVTDAAAPVELADAPLSGGVDAIALDGHTLYLHQGWVHNDLHVVDVSDPTAPLPVVAIDSVDGTADLEVADNRLYIAWLGALRVLDISNPAVPIQVAEIEAHDATESVAIVDDIAYVAEGDAGFRILAPGDNGAAVPAIGQTPTAGWTTGIAFDGTYAYVSGRLFGLEVVDVSDPSDPTVAATLPMPSAFDTALGVARAGNYLYIADGTQGFKVVDISDPTSPSIVGSLATPASASDVVVVGSFAYVANDAILLVIDVSLPTAPTIETSLAVEAYRLHKDGETVYVGGGWIGGFHIVDATTPAAPILVGSLEDASVNDIDIIGDVAVLATHWTGLRVTDVSNPSAPSWIGGSQPTPFHATGVTALGDVAYVTDNYGGVYVFDLSDPAVPSRIGHAAGEHCERLDIFDDMLFVARGYNGLALYPTHCSIVSTDQPIEPAVVAGPTLAARPNPSSADVRLSLSVPTDGEVTVDVFDVSGRRVGATRLGVVAAGEHDVALAGDTFGIEAGVYFVRARGVDFETAPLRIVRTR